MTAALESSNELRPSPHTDYSIEISSHNLHVLDYGTVCKPDMLCVHGTGANAHWFDFIASGFTDDFHVRAFDQRGHGDSEWDHSPEPDYSIQSYANDLKLVVEKHDLRDFVLVGHSVGGVVSALYTSLYPERIKALILIDSTICMLPEQILSMRAVGSREGRSYADEDEFLANYQIRPSGSLAPAEVIRHIAKNCGRRFDDGRWRYKFDRRVYTLREHWDSLPFWSNIKIPALLIRGDRGARITSEIFAQVKLRAPQVSIAEIPNSGHHVTLDNPHVLIQKLKIFFNNNK